MMCKIWKKTIIRDLAAALILFGAATTASAIPVISIDLDPTTAGIQSSLSVASGSSFTIDMVVTGDGVTLFDTFAFAADFNDAGAVLGLFGGTGSPTAGGIAGTAPVVIDAFSAFPVTPGSPLTGFPFPPTPGFAGSSDGVGMTSLGLPFAPIPPGVTIDLFSLTLLAMAPGTSTVSPNAGFLGGLAFAGFSVPFGTAGGTVTVMPAVIPVPAAIWLFGTALIGLVGLRKRKAAVAI